MKLELCEKINTSYLSGKAEVMRLAAEGRQVVWKPAGFHCEFQLCTQPPSWDWSKITYGVLKAAPREMWFNRWPNGSEDGPWSSCDGAATIAASKGFGARQVCYREVIE